ncbi:MAG TPA: chromate transporter [Anaerolineales bacterium]
MTQTKFDLSLQLFWMFLKINVLSTSGHASVGLLYKESVDKNLMTEAQFVEAVGFSNLLPGSDALQLAMFVGYSVAGMTGASIALLGSILPPTVLMLGVAALIHRFQGEVWMQGFMSGLTPAVAMLIVIVAWQIFRTEGFKTSLWRTLLIGSLSAIGFWLDFPSPLVLLGAGILGIILFGKRSI